MIPRPPSLPRELLDTVLSDDGYMTECPACSCCRYCKGSGWVTPEQKDEWDERHPQARMASTIPAPPGE